jgi:hypothetical protein
MCRRSSRMYSCILDLPQHVSVSHGHHKGVVVTSEATQGCIWITARPVWSFFKGWLHPSTTDHSYYFLNAFDGCFITILQRCLVQLSRCKIDVCIANIFLTCSISLYQRSCGGGPRAQQTMWSLHCSTLKVLWQQCCHVHNYTKRQNVWGIFFWRRARSTQGTMLHSYFLQA